MLKSSVTVAILQPGYIPWLGFFDQVRRSDIFVYYDDVQYDKHGWRNRNRIKSPKGPQWLTVPVLHKGMNKPLINDILIDSRASWQRKHTGSLRQFYSDAAFKDDYLPEFEGILNQPWERLVDLDIAVIEWLCGRLGLKRPMVRSSNLGIPGEQSERLAAICRYFGATRYFSGDAARNYIDLQVFQSRNIAVKWQHYLHPVYRQLHGEFVPYLSVLDLLLNEGPESFNILSSQKLTESL